MPPRRIARTRVPQFPDHTPVEMIAALPLTMVLLPETYATRPRPERLREHRLQSSTVLRVRPEDEDIDRMSPLFIQRATTPPRHLGHGSADVAFTPVDPLPDVLLDEGLLHASDARPRLRRPQRGSAFNAPSSEVRDNTYAWDVSLCVPGGDSTRPRVLVRPVHVPDSHWLNAEIAKGDVQTYTVCNFTVGAALPRTPPRRQQPAHRQVPDSAPDDLAALAGWAVFVAPHTTRGRALPRQGNRTATDDVATWNALTPFEVMGWRGQAGKRVLAPVERGHGAVTPDLSLWDLPSAPMDWGWQTQPLPRTARAVQRDHGADVLPMPVLGNVFEFSYASTVARKRRGSDEVGRGAVSQPERIPDSDPPLVVGWLSESTHSRRMTHAPVGITSLPPWRVYVSIVVSGPWFVRAAQTYVSGAVEGMAVSE